MITSTSLSYFDRYHRLGLRSPAVNSVNQWRSKGERGAGGGTRSGAQALGAQQHTNCSHLKRVFK